MIIENKRARQARTVITAALGVFVAYGLCDKFITRKADTPCASSEPVRPAAAQGNAQHPVCTYPQLNR